jgi:hypothetical protein
MAEAEEHVWEGEITWQNGSQRYSGVRLALFVITQSLKPHSDPSRTTFKPFRGASNDLITLLWDPSLKGSIILLI